MSYELFGRFVLSVVVILCFIFRYRPRKPLFVYPISTTQGKKALLFSLVRGSTLVLSVLWAFDIRRKTSVVPVQVPSHNVLFLLDGSLSMSADDVSPNRFSRARDIITSLSQAASGAQQGLIVFSGIPVLRAPRTNDIVGFQHLVSGMKLGDFPPTDGFLGTALGDALLLSLQQFTLLSGQRARSIVIISDGDSNMGYDPYRTLGVLRNEQIPVYFIALGEDGYTVGTDEAGLPVTTAFDPELMQNFADQTDGKLYRNPTADDMSELKASLLNKGNRQMQTVYLSREGRLNDELWIFLMIGFVVLGVDAVIRLVKKY